MGIAFFAQYLTDYPNGSLPDYIGQRYLISFSLLFFSIDYFLISKYDGYMLYLIAAIFFGAGQGQINGSFESYLDNNYKIAMKDLDQDRKIYGFMYQRIITIGSLCMAMSFVLGGIISTIYSRSAVFELTSILAILLIPIILFFLKDIKIEGSTTDKPKKNHILIILKTVFLSSFHRRNFHSFLSVYP